MQSAKRQLLPSASGRKVVPPFRVVIVYEDFTAAQQAKAAYDFLTANLTHEWQVTRQTWKFELLRLPELCALAAEDAALADVIIVACRGEGELPAPVRAWVEKWLGYRADNVALIALLDCPPEQAKGPEATQDYLERVARQADLEFFVWPHGLPKLEGLRPARAPAAEEELVRQAA